jgi:hypothetical protein
MNVRVPRRLIIWWNGRSRDEYRCDAASRGAEPDRDESPSVRAHAPPGSYRRPAWRPAVEASLTIMHSSGAARPSPPSAHGVAMRISGPLWFHSAAVRRQLPAVGGLHELQSDGGRSPRRSIRGHPWTPGLPAGDRVQGLNRLRRPVSRVPRSPVLRDTIRQTVATGGQSPRNSRGERAPGFRRERVMQKKIGLVQFTGFSGSKDGHIGSRIVDFRNVRAGSLTRIRPFALGGQP